MTKFFKNNQIVHLCAICGVCAGQLIFCGVCRVFGPKFPSETLNTIRRWGFALANGALEYFTVASAKPGSTCEYLLTLRHMGTVEIHSLNRPGALATADSLPDRAMTGRDSLPRTGSRSQTFTQTQLDNSASPRAAIAPAILRARRCSASTPETRTHYHGYHHERERMRFQVQR